MPVEKFPNERKDRPDRIPGGDFFGKWGGVDTLQFAPPAEYVYPRAQIAGQSPFSPIRAFGGPPFSLFGVYLVSASYRGASGTAPTQPCGLQISIRGGFGGICTEYFSGAFLPKLSTNHGLLVQVSGIMCTQWEVWGRAIDDTAAGVAATQTLLNLGFELSNIGGNGGLSIVTGDMFFGGP